MAGDSFDLEKATQSMGSILVDADTPAGKSAAIQMYTDIPGSHRLEVIRNSVAAHPDSLNLEALVEGGKTTLIVERSSDKFAHVDRIFKFDMPKSDPILDAYCNVVKQEGTPEVSQRIEKFVKMNDSLAAANTISCVADSNREFVLPKVVLTGGNDGQKITFDAPLNGYMRINRVNEAGNPVPFMTVRVTKQQEADKAQ